MTPAGGWGRLLLGVLSGRAFRGAPLPARPLRVLPARGAWSREPPGRAPTESGRLSPAAPSGNVGEQGRCLRVRPGKHVGVPGDPDTSVQRAHTPLRSIVRPTRGDTHGRDVPEGPGLSQRRRSRAPPRRGGAEHRGGSGVGSTWLPASGTAHSGSGPHPFAWLRPFPAPPLASAALLLSAAGWHVHFLACVAWAHRKGNSATHRAKGRSQNQDPSGSPARLGQSRSWAARPRGSSLLRGG